MPIYAYKCESCGHAKDILRKISDLPLTDCPQCGASTFKKQLTSAGFQLKGSGWYVTDFRGGDSGAQTSKSAETTETASAETAGKISDSSAATAPVATPTAASTASPVVSAAPVSKVASTSSTTKTS